MGIIRIHAHSCIDLPKIIHAGGSLRLGFRTAQSRQQQRGKYGEDGNNDQQLNQGECGRGLQIVFMPL